MSKAYSLTGTAKIHYVNEFIEDLIENESKFIVFAHHLDVLDGVEAFVKKKGIKYIRIDGSVKMEDRHQRVRQFQELNDIKIGVLSITACS